MSPRNAVAASVLLLAACPHAPPPPPPPEPPEQTVLQPAVKALSAEAEALLRQQDELIWKHWTQGAPLDIAKTYGGHDALFTADSIKKVSRLRQLAKDPREQRALTHLLTHFVGEYLARALSEQAEAIAGLEASVTFSANGSDVPYRELEHRLATEKSASKRLALYAAATPAVQRISALVQVKQERIDSLLKELGYASYEAFGAQLREADLVELAALADQVLQVTQGPYERVMEQLTQRELQIPFAKLRRSDLPRLFRSGGVDKDFTKEAQLGRVKETLKGLGLEVGSLHQLKLDDSDAPKKSARALTLAVHIPDDVRLSMRPTAGVHAEGTLLHEMGHALHYAFAKETRFELAKLGDAAAYEAQALLFEDLLGDPVWLQELTALSSDKLTDYLASTSAFKLYLLRLHAAHVLYEVELHRAERAEAKALYTAVFSRALGVALDQDEQARFAVEQEDFYPSVDSFRAGFLAGQIQAQLKARFGPAWWHQPNSATYLQGLWAPANGLSAQELAVKLGDRGIRPDGLLLRLGALLKIQMTLPTGLGIAPDAGTAPAARATPDAGAATSRDAG